ncbi:MAG: sugar transferase [Atopobiaceae bacterium]|jgi:exopolysaccharide biosynthesis polyprenyl glycosylphosphotransferase|nr:sugar transferase [Atopobiaceae bacterium]MCH4180959.1 sugar transferase [Atopobiaceae bacterium]MCH4230257.1 sugar transferase [Atopobiaceae bacterium]MCI1226372.1 sugar transferase [Atopobiaceae bacterium]MCI1260367.1 sugar transferase [Atopobiaceae bacterium]
MNAAESIYTRLSHYLGNHLWVVTFVCDAVASVLANTIAFGALGLFYIESCGLPIFHLLAVSAVLITFVVFLACGLYASRRYRPFSFEVGRLLLANSIVYLLEISALYFFHLNDMSRLALLLAFGFTNLLDIAERFMWRRIVASCYRGGVGLHKLLIIGSSNVAEQFYNEAVKTGRSSAYGFEYVGYIAHKRNSNLSTYLGDIDSLDSLLRSQQVTEIIIASELPNNDTCGQVIAASSVFGIRVSVIPEIGDFFPHNSSDETVGTLKLFTLQSSADSNPGWGISKRCLDILGGVLGLVLSSPLMLLGAILIKTASPEGPVIFKQQRLGKNGKPFTMYKLRTMVPDAEKLRKDLDEANEVDGPVFKMSSDPRVIKHGAFLRKSSIDELPQLLNVIQGSMSLVGPRPPLPDEVERYDSWERVRLAVKPGLTCYWQVSGRSNLSFDEWMELDLRYVETQSFMTDIMLILKTFGEVFSRDGAY